MPSSRELKALLQPLLKRHPELAFTRRFLFFKPLTHYLRGVVFIHRNSGSVEARTFATPLFDGQGQHPIIDEGRDGYSYYLRDWRQHDREELSRDFCDRLEREALPPVEEITDPRKHEANIPYFGHLPEDGIALLHLRLAVGACYYGDYERARKATSGYDRVDHPWWRDDWPPAEECKYEFYPPKRAFYLAKMLRENEDGIPQLLRDWEKHSVETNKLTKYWKPTPFPCDGKSGESP